MNLSLLAELKERLIHATEFIKVWEYFLDHFGENPDFIALGERTQNDLVEAIIIQTAKQVHGQDLKPQESLLTRLPEYQFIHGGCFKKGKMTNVLYFEDIFMGTLMLCAVGDDNTTAVRFSGRKLTPPAEPSMN